MTEPKLDIDAIEAEANEAAPGPWKWDEDWGVNLFSADPNQELMHCAMWVHGPSMKFIANARENVRLLIARIRELEAR